MCKSLCIKGEARASKPGLLNVCKKKKNQSQMWPARPGGAPSRTPAPYAIVLLPEVTCGSTPVKAEIKMNWGEGGARTLVSLVLPYVKTGIKPKAAAAAGSAPHSLGNFSEVPLPTPVNHLQDTRPISTHSPIKGMHSGLCPSCRPAEGEGKARPAHSGGGGSAGGLTGPTRPAAKHS